MKIIDKTERKRPTVLYGLLLLAECFMWGVANAVNKLGFEFITPLWLLVFRYFFSFILFFLIFRKRIKAKYDRKTLKPAIIVSLWTAAAFILGFLAIDNTSATNAGFLMSLAVVFSPLLSVAFLKTRFRWIQLIPVTVAAAGLYCICGADITSLNLGDILAILCSCCSAMMLISSNKHIGGGAIDPIVLCLVQCAVCLACCLPLAFIFEPLPVIASFPPIVWYNIVFMVVGCTFLAYIFQNVALGKVSATFGALVFCTEPIFTAIAAYILLDERMSAISVIGAVLIMGGICFAALIEAGNAPKEPSQADNEIREEGDSTNGLQ